MIVIAGFGLDAPVDPMFGHAGGEMKYNKILLCMMAFVCLAFQASAQDGASSTMGSGGDWISPNMGDGGGDIAQYFTDPIFYTNPISYQFRADPYPGPYGVYPFNPEPYYSDFRLKSLASLHWEPFQKSNWSEMINYAKTRSSMRVYQNGAWLSP